MYILKNRLVPITHLLILVIGALGLVPILAQSNDIVLTVAIEEWQSNFFNDDMFADFEAEHPHVKVLTVIIPQDDRYFANPSEVSEVPEFLEKATNLASHADLLQLQTYNLNRMMTRAGAYLDITPLLNADMDANLEDFYPAMLQSFQWDAGTWGLPIAGSEQIIIYNKTKFDELGLSYPDETWTLSDYLTVGRELTVYDADGNVELPGFFGFDSASFLQAVYGRSIIDSTSYPEMPLLTDPELADIVEQWAAFQADTNPESFGFDFQSIPMTIQGTFFLNPNFNGSDSDTVWAGALLPGGTAALQVQGYAISAGTQYPELSYELLQYMTKSPDITYTFFGSTAARKSMVGVQPEDSPIIFSDPSPEAQAMSDLALANAIPASERDFFFYIDMAVSKINDESLDAATALQEVQDKTIAIFQAIDEQSSKTLIAVATPVPTPVLAANEVSLTFGIEANFSPLPNRELWEDAIKQFVTQDAQIGQIVLNTNYLQYDERVDTQDCFYLSSNLVPQADLSSLLSIGPFLAADPNFDPDNVMNGALLQLTRDNAIWAIPLSLDPQVIWYDPNVFAEAGLSEPSNDWTVFDFIDDLQELKAYTGEAPYNSQGYGGGYLRILIAAFGGNLMDASSAIYKLNLSDPNTIEAVRQVLNLARDGYLNYQELAGNGGPSFSNDVPMFDAQLQPYGYRFQNRGEEFGDPHRVVLFPRGTRYIPVSYMLGAGYISANSPTPEACYRFLSYISQHPELLFGIPAQRSLFDEAVALIDDNSDLAALYYAFDAALQEPDAVVVSDPFGFGSVADVSASFSNYLTIRWLNRAFDRYVLEDADLEFELSQAQQFSEEFHVCVATIPPLDRPLSQLSGEEAQAFAKQFQDCAVGVDPSLNEMFGGGGGGGGGGG